MKAQEREVRDGIMDIGIDVVCVCLAERSPVKKYLWAGFLVKVRRFRRNRVLGGVPRNSGKS
jgi:hypothetical protein